MGDITGAGGTTTSLSNTPQAGDDCYDYVEDLLLANSTLYNQTTETLTLDVMSNDLGGKAKSLFSISDVDGTPLDDLVVKDLLSTSSLWEQTTLGNWMRINNGKIEYRLNDGRDPNFDPSAGRDINSLSVSDAIADSFVYAIKLGNGTLSWATVRVNLTGSNDAMTLGAGGDVTGAVSETVGIPAANAADLTDTGSFTYNDVDTADIATVSSALKSVNGSDAAAALALAKGSLAASISGDTALTNGGTVNWTYSVDPDSLESMAQGETLILVYTVTVSDGHGSTVSRDVTVTVTGTNDAPVITSGTQDGAVQEDGTLSATGQAAASDVDNGAVLTFSGDADSPYGSFAITPGGAWTYTLDNAAAQSLAAGETKTESFTITVTDQHGAADTETVTITITGTNDAPVVSGAVTAEVAEGGSSVTRDALANASDVDNGAVLSVVNVPASLPAGVSYNPATHSFTLDPSDPAYDYLAVGASTTVTVNYGVSDGLATTPAAVTFTITGTNDVPEITGGQTSGSVFEGDGLPPAHKSTSGTLSVTDPDVGDTHSWSVSDAADHGTATVDDFGYWTYTVTDADEVDALAEGQTMSDFFTVMVDDGHGGTDTQEVEIMITGTNDGPLISIGADDEADASLNETNTTISTNGTLTVIDVDTTDTVSASVTGVVASGDKAGVVSSATLQAMLSLTAGPIAADSGSAGNLAWSFDSAGEAFDFLAVGEALVVTYTIEVADNHGAKDTQEVVITIHGSNDGPAGVASAVLELGIEDIPYDVTAAQLLAGFSDVDGDELSVIDLIADHGTVTDNGDGTFTIVPDANYNGLVTLNYTVIDGHGSAIAGNQTFTLGAVNDAASIVVDANVSQDTSVTEDSDFVAGGKLTVSDVDAGESVLGDASTGAHLGSYGTFTILADGTWSYALNNALAAVQALNANDTRTDSFTVHSQDGTASYALSVTINGANEISVFTPPTKDGEFTGTGDSNDFDNAGGPVSATVVNQTNGNPNPSGGQIDGSNLADTIYASAGDDTVYGHDGDDSLRGEQDADTSLYGQVGNDTLTGGANADEIFGGSGNDKIFGYEAPDTSTNNSNTNDLGDQLYGGSGKDQIYGQAGNDLIIGGFGGDELWGHGGGDTFKFIDARDRGDILKDFSVTGGDKLDFSLIDANTSVSAAGDQNFTWGGTTATANGLWYHYDAGTGKTTLYGDTDGNVSTAEFWVEFDGNIDLNLLQSTAGGITL